MRWHHRLYQRLCARADELAFALLRAGRDPEALPPGGLGELCGGMAIRVYDRIFARRRGKFYGNRVTDWPARVWGKRRR